ncbi:hypothetical protein BX600DRAFT_203011 [Xylariales sp. PMI_506]|nr:hypothetical protein BX600DRAFT_203011 [Xylariales sp. PMI_506]
MSEADAQRSLRKRRRPPKSCEQCRKRKLKCDRKLPCAPCKRSRRRLLCTYREDIGRSSYSTPSPPRERLLEIGQSEHDIEAHYVDGQTERMCLDRIDVGTEKTWPPSVVMSNPTPRPHLRVELGKNRLYGQAHWMHALEQFQVLAKLQSPADTHRGHSRTEITTTTKEAMKLRQTVKSQRSVDINDPVPNLVDTIPPKDICDLLLDHYLRLFEPMFRVVHVPSFKEEYERFWDRQSSPDTPFLLKLAMILALGSIFDHDRNRSDQIHNVAQSWVYAAHWWLTGPTGRIAMSLDGVQIFCLWLLACQANSLGGATSISTESLTKLAFTIGLHLDPSGIHSLSEFQREMRRRLWTTVLELSVMTSLDSTLPLLISTDDFTCGPPSNFNDTDFGPQTQVMPAPHPIDERTDTSLQLLLHRSLESRLRAVRKLNNLGPILSYEETVQIGNQLKQHCRQTVAFFRRRSLNDGPSAEFHRDFIDSYLRRYTLFVHRLYALQARKDPRFLFARKIVLESSQIIASHAENMHLPSAVVDDFLLLAMRGSGLFKGPLSQDVIVSLGLEVATQIEEERGFDETCDHATVSEDPVLQLARATRQPLIDMLRHIREQLREVIALGRPSCKRYIVLTTMLTHIEAMESTVADPRGEALSSMVSAVRDCHRMLRQMILQGSEASPDMEWSVDTSPDWMNSLGFTGFELDFMDPCLSLEVVETLTPQPTTDSGD